MKKIITFIFCMCLLPLAGKAQESLETATMRISDDCSYQVIVPYGRQPPFDCQYGRGDIQGNNEPLPLPPRPAALRQFVCLHQLESRLLPLQQQGIGRKHRVVRPLRRQKQVCRLLDIPPSGLSKNLHPGLIPATVALLSEGGGHQTLLRPEIQWPFVWHRGRPHTRE